MSAPHTFDYAFSVQALLAAVDKFYHSDRTHPRLTPPPGWGRLHRIDPLGESWLADFGLRPGSPPGCGVATHSQVDPLRSFTDTQQSGPLRFWQHTLRFEALAANTTWVTEHIEDEYNSGWSRWLSRVLYNRLAPGGLFCYRAWVTRRALRGAGARQLGHARL